jgi:phosphoglycerate dehydrogenase-like enzyme
MMQGTGMQGTGMQGTGQQGTGQRGTGQHRDLLAEAGGVFVEPQPEPGPVTILPKSNDVFADAVVAGGGDVVPLSDETRGIVWVSNERPEELATALAEHPGIGWVQLPWAGVDTFSDILAGFAKGAGPLVTSAKGAYSEPVAEQAVALSLALLRGYPQRAVSTSWAQTSTGLSIYGRNVLIVGAGGIAHEIIRLLSVFDVAVTVVRRAPGAVDGAALTVTADRLHDVLPDADVVILAAASTTGTARMFTASEFSLMKRDAVFVNIARGALVDTDALVHALGSGEIAGAGLDVTDPEPLPDGHPLWNVPNCLITSHSADTPPMTAPLLAHRITSNVRAFLGDGRFVGIVDPAEGY